MFILTTAQKLGTEVCNYTVSLLHVLVFFFGHIQGGIQQIKTQHWLTLP